MAPLRTYGLSIRRRHQAYILLPAPPILGCRIADIPSRCKRLRRASIRDKYQTQAFLPKTIRWAWGRACTAVSCGLARGVQFLPYVPAVRSLHERTQSTAGRRDPHGHDSAWISRKLHDEGPTFAATHRKLKKSSKEEQKNIRIFQVILLSSITLSNLQTDRLQARFLRGKL